MGERAAPPYLIMTRKKSKRRSRRKSTRKKSRKSGTYGGASNKTIEPIESAKNYPENTVLIGQDKFYWMNIDGVWGKPQPQFELRKEFNKQNGIASIPAEDLKSHKKVIINSSKKTNKLVSRKQTPYKPDDNEIAPKELKKSHTSQPKESKKRHTSQPRESKKSRQSRGREKGQSPTHSPRLKERPPEKHKKHVSSNHDINKIKEIFANIKNIKPTPVASPPAKKTNPTILPMFLKKVIINNEFSYGLDEITTRKH